VTAHSALSKVLVYRLTLAKTGSRSWLYSSRHANPYMIAGGNTYQHSRS
jgi:hypothetical protein